MWQSIEHKKYVIAFLGWLTIAIHFLIFMHFFPNLQGKLIHDHSYNLPLLLNGYYWYLNNGFWSVPWFTPAFCGGMPLIANPTSFYYSVPQFLTFFIDPLISVRITFLIFACLGFWGMYLLLRSIFRASGWSALLAGALFLFNGFYAYRFIVGHMEFHGVMLVPFLAYFLLRVEDRQSPYWKLRWGIDISAGALLLAYMFMSGMAQLMMPVVFSTILLALTLSLYDPSERILPIFSWRLLFSGVLALCLSAAKLVAALSFLRHFPRNLYPLPGADGIGKLLLLIGRVLTFGGGGVDLFRVLRNRPYDLPQHEFEYGLTVVPAALLALFCLSRLRHLPSMLRNLAQRRRILTLGAILLILAVPLALNYYSPVWNRILKSIPIIKSTTTFIRWLIIYIPFVVLLTALAAEKCTLWQRRRPLLVIVCLYIVFGQNLFADKSYYRIEEYDPGNILMAYAKAKTSGTPPVISRLIASPADRFRRPPYFAHNGVLTEGYSQILCYEHMFGYSLELFPFKTIREGPALLTDRGVLNLKNPSCYLYPQENQCTPGDHFRTDQITMASQFINFRPFVFQVSRMQHLANWLNLAALGAVTLFAILTAAIFLRRRLIKQKRFQ
jgi:hypothetical protein